MKPELKMNASRATFHIQTKHLAARLLCIAVLLGGCGSQPASPEPTFQPVIVFNVTAIPATPPVAADTATDVPGPSATSVPTALISNIQMGTRTSTPIQTQTPVATPHTATPPARAALSSPSTNYVSSATIIGITTTIDASGLVTVVNTMVGSAGTVLIFTTTVDAFGALMLVTSTLQPAPIRTEVAYHPLQRPSPTPLPTNPGILYSAPKVTMPLEGEFRHALTPPMVAWTGPALNGPTDYFAVFIHHNRGWNVACYKTYQGLAPGWLPNELPHHGFGVYVVIIRSPLPVAEGAYCAGFEVSPPSAQVNFYWTFQ